MDKLKGQYIDLLGRGRLNFSSSRSRVQGLKFFTIHPVFAAQVNYAKDKLAEHFANPSGRPLNCLVLGAPGSGKSFLVKTLRDAATGHNEREGFYQEYNLSQCGSISEVRSIFKEISEINYRHHSRPGVVFFDEFDVRISGCSAIQALISPIYDREDFKNIAFIFSGSYLKNRRMLGVQLDSAMEFDIRRFMAVLRVYTLESDAKQEFAELDEIIWRLETRRLRDPDENVMEYLSSLEKLTDFRSRINGFVIEIPELDCPLEITSDRFCIESHSAPSGRLVPGPRCQVDLFEFVRMLEGEKPNDKPYSKYFSTLDAALSEYQNTILEERLWRVVLQFKKQFGKTGPKTSDRRSGIRIDRSLLNYLATVPLRHGMRSLEYLISLLKPDDGNVILPTKHREMLKYHLQDVEEFISPEAVWQRMQLRNRGLASLPGDQTINVIWDEDPPEPPKKPKKKSHR